MIVMLNEEDIAEKPIGEGVDLKSPSCLKTISLGGHPPASGDPGGLTRGVPQQSYEGDARVAADVSLA